MQFLLRISAFALLFISGLMVGACADPVEIYVWEGNRYLLETNSAVVTNYTAFLLSSPIADATIAYSIDGSEPATNQMVSSGYSQFVYSTTTVRAAALQDGRMLGTANVTIEVRDPIALRIRRNGIEFFGKSVTFVGAQQLYFDTYFPGGHVYYTLDGSEPTRQSNTFPGGGGFLSFTNTTLFRGIAFNSDYTQSAARDLLVSILPPVTLRVIGGTAENISVSTPGYTGEFGNYSEITVGSNSVVRLTAIDARFTRWRGFTNSTSRTLELNMDRNREIQPLFFSTNALDTTVISGEGKIEISPPPPYELSPDASNPGIQISAVPQPGSYFAGWYYWSGRVAMPAAWPQASSRHIWTPDPRQLIAAKFERLPASHHTLILKGEGAVNFAPLDTYLYTNGSKITVTAIPEPGYIFSHWSGDAQGTNAAVEITFNSDKTVIAHSVPLLEWNSFFPLPFGNLWNPPAVAPSGRVYVTSTPTDHPPANPGTLNTLNSFGLSDWWVVLPDEHIGAPVLGPDESIYVGTFNNLRAFSKAGNLKWQTPAGALSIALGSDAIFAAGTNSLIHKLSFGGSILQSVRIPSLGASLALDANENLIVQAQDTFYLLSNSLEILWQQTVSNINSLFVPSMLSVAADGAIYGSAGAITSLSPDGRLNWFLPGSEWGPVLRAPNSVFLPLAPWGFDLNGTPRWNGTVPAAVQPNVAAEDGSLIGIEELELSGGPWTRITHFTENGATVWSTRLEYSGLNPNAYRLLSVMDQNGTLYIPAHSIWAVHTGLRPARSGWPMWRGDWRNSGSVFTQDLPLPPRNLLRASVDSASTTLEYTGEYGKTYSLESSNDLIQWTVVQTFAENLNLALETRSSKQFFRVTQE